MNHSHNDRDRSAHAATPERMESNLVIQQPPKSWRQRLMWLGPGLTWMAAGAGGAGEFLFPPKVSATEQIAGAMKIFCTGSILSSS